MIDGVLARRVEEACLNGWPAPRQVLFDGWLLRFSAGHTRRANSVNPLTAGTRALADKIAYCESLYRRVALPVVFRVPGIAEAGLDAALDAAHYAPPEDESCVLCLDFTRSAPSPGGAELVEGAPGTEWIDAHSRCVASDAAARRGQRDILAALAVPAVFAGLRGEDGRLVSVAFGALHDRILCLNLVATESALRRRGLSRRTVASVLAWGRERGAERACLAVVATNTPAVTLYQQLGFTAELYRYHYRRLAPAGE